MGSHPEKVILNNFLERKTSILFVNKNFVRAEGRSIKCKKYLNFLIPFFRQIWTSFMEVLLFFYRESYQQVWIQMIKKFLLI